MAVSGVSEQKTIQQIIDEGAKKASDRNTGELGKDDFLNLLVTQLRYQDPLKPTDDAQFIAQMAQFSSLEQMQNMNNSLAQAQGFSLIGKHVTADITDDVTKAINTVEGDVTSVKVESGKVSVVVNGKDIPIEKIINVTESLRNTTASEISKYADLIGCRVDAYAYDSATSNVVKVSGPVMSVERGSYEDYAVMDGVRVNIAGVVTTTPSTDPDFIKNYLSANKGKAVSVNIVDRSTGQSVPVSATLNDYTVAADGTITAVLDQVAVPVDSIASLKKS